MLKGALIGIGSGAGGLARKAAGFALVLTAFGGRAMAFGTPEIDPGSALGAMTLLSCGILMLTGRRRRAA